MVLGGCRKVINRRRRPDEEDEKDIVVVCSEVIGVKRVFAGKSFFAKI